MKVTVLLWALVCLILCAGSALAQTAPPARWISLDQSRPGAPADIIFDAERSNASISYLDVVIHGFWMETKRGPDGVVYSKISVPGLGTVNHTGAPALPAGRFDLAIFTEATRLQLQTVSRYEVRRFTDVLVWPQPIPEMDHDGRPEIFRRDDAIYRSQRPWPTVDGMGTHALRSKLGSIQGITAEVYPFQWNPASRLLTVDMRVRYAFAHPGRPVVQHAITKERSALAGKQFLNWDVVSQYSPINFLFFEGDFLFIYPPGYQNALLPLINQKKARGFTVKELTTAQTGTTCNSIRNAIQNWYNSLPDWKDKYALLVGDVDTIPFCTAPTGDPTDDLYASTDGDDLDPEIFLGRLAVRSETDTANQVEKILRYENDPALFCCYDRALLVAHKEDAPGKYVGAHESVRTASYSVPPTFSTLYGHVAGVNNAGVSAALNSGIGLVAYRGHGSETAWTGWDLGNQYYSTTEVSALTNDPRQGPVVWSFACSNSDLRVTDAIAKVWMRESGQRAVSHYGASVPSFTDQNHELDRRMFKAVFDLGLTTQSHAIKYAEKKMGEVVGSDNAWMYHLLGDPDMQIRRRNPINWVIAKPDYVAVCDPVGPCPLEIAVYDAAGNPVSDVLVAAWKPGDAVDEVLDNRYTGPDGLVQIPIVPSTPGDLYFTVQDRSGNMYVDTIPVTAP